MTTTSSFTVVKPPAPCCGERLNIAVSDASGRVVDLPQACPGCGHRFALRELVALRELAVGMWDYVDHSEHGAGAF